MKKKYLLYFLMVILLITIDQLSKIYVKTHFYLGEEIIVIPYWFRIAFTENPGAAFGLQIGGELGKYFLSIFRLVFSFGLIFFLYKKIQLKNSFFLKISLTFILAGAIGNVIDGVLYGSIFSESSYFKSNIAHTVPFGTGYSGLFLGNVVDMFYFPIINSKFPTWMPLIGGNPFTFFSPIFNIADSCITIGMFLLFFNLKKLES